MLYTAIYTDQGGRPSNEDTARARRQGTDTLCLVVADGLGGHGGGKTASFTAAKSICAAWQGETDPEGLRPLVQKAHEAVLAAQTPTCQMKSTVVMLTIANGQAAWAHVGDSRLYRFHEGTLEFQTRDHSASQVAVLLGDITQDQIRFHEDRSRILRALGQEGEVKAEVGGMALQPGKYAFLLCADGFWEYVLEPEMEEDLRAAANPEDWLARMRQRLAQRVPPDNDNNTAAAVWLEP